MTDPHHPTATDFLDAARRHAVQHTPAAVRHSRRQLLEDMLAQPLPPLDNSHDTQMRQRLLAHIELTLGDILSPLATLPPRKGERFWIKITPNIWPGTDHWYCSAQIEGIYGSASQRKTKARKDTPPLAPATRFCLYVTLNPCDDQKYLLFDDSRQHIEDGVLQSKTVRTQDAAFLRTALGETIASIAPARLDDLAAHIAANPSPLDVPASLKKPLLLETPPLSFARKARHDRPA